MPAELHSSGRDSNLCYYVFNYSIQLESYTSHHIQKTDAGLDRPLYLRNKLYDKTLKSENLLLCYTIRYEMIFFYVRSKADMSRTDLYKGH